MKSWSKLLSVVLVSSLLISSNVSAASLKQGNKYKVNDALLEIMGEINKQHKSIKKPVIDFQKYTQNFSVEASKYSDYAPDGNKPFNPETIYSLNAITADLDVLFDILHTTYGGYYYFGGDEAFNKAKASIINDCKAMHEITGQAVMESICKNLSFIKDRHFNVNGTGFYKGFLAHMYTGTDFIKTNDGFKNKENNKEVAGIEGNKQWKKQFKMFISPKGELVYHPTLLAEQNPGNIVVLYSDGSHETLTPSSFNGGEQDVKLSGFGNIPTIRISSMGFDNTKKGVGARKFLEYAKTYKNEPILIVDLRDNGGGNGVLPMKWFKEYAGQLVPTNYSSLKYMNDDELKEMCKDKENIYYTPYQELSEIGGFEPISKQYMKAVSQPDNFVKNEQMLIILVNKNVASSAEMFVDIAHNLENTLIVGTNTAGVLVGDAFTQIALPNTHIEIQLGAGISFFPENYFEEYVGFEPDLWVDGNAEEAIYKLLNNH